MASIDPPNSPMSAEPCHCAVMHYRCDPTTCSDVPNPVIEPWQKGLIGDTFNIMWPQLSDTANAGCPTCQLIRKGVVAFIDGIEHDRAVLGKNFNLRFIRRPRPRKDSVLLELSNEKFRHTIEFRQALPSGCKAFTAGDFNTLATGVPYAFEQCDKWIRDCLQNHTACQVKGLLLPRRVVDIGHIEGEEFSPRLHESRGETGEYSALSHCWGATLTLKTTIETLSGRKSVIPWNSFPKIFKEAIIITHKLGLIYIWIDSLCIIQDSRSDWETESKKMGFIYGNSKVTIAAVKSRDSEGGCFTGSDKIITFAHTHPTLHSPIAIRKYSQHHEYAFWNNDYAGRLKNTPLFSRAWTLQKELLAPRVLYYGPNELVFQCRTQLDCQCGTIPITSVLHNSTELQTPKRMWHSAFLKSSDSLQMLQKWSRIIQQYSSRSLTLESDRFPSISGLAREFHNGNLERYIAGIWTKHLALWLIWALTNEQGGERTQTYIAPSWSWASMAAGNTVYYNAFVLTFIDRDWRSHITMVEAACEPAGPDPTGAIRSGYLIVRGRAMTADLWIDATRTRCRMQRGEWEARKVYLDIAQHRLESDPLKPQVVYCLLICEGHGGAWMLVLAPAERERERV